MADVYFETFDSVLAYREDRLTFSMVELYKSCSMLNALIIKDDPGFYRVGKSTPLIRKGDVVTVKTDNKFVKMVYLSGDAGLPILTYEAILGMDSAIYREDTISEIIPPIKKASRKNLFSDEPIVPNNFVRALHSIFSILIEDNIGREHVVDYSSELREVLIVQKGNEFELQEQARNHLYIEQVKSGKRTPINDETIANTVASFIYDYDRLINTIIAEVNAVTGGSVSQFVSERPCSRYHFDDDGSFFFIERGMDTRIYKWEQDKFSKLNEIEEATGVKVDKVVAPWHSAKYDLF